MILTKLLTDSNNVDSKELFEALKFSKSISYDDWIKTIESNVMYRDSKICKVICHYW